jgi:hypothetical protein
MEQDKEEDRAEALPLAWEMKEGVQVPVAWELQWPSKPVEATPQYTAEEVLAALKKALARYDGAYEYVAAHNTFGTTNDDCVAVRFPMKSIDGNEERTDSSCMMSVGISITKQCIEWEEG